MTCLAEEYLLQFLLHLDERLFDCAQSTRFYPQALVLLALPPLDLPLNLLLSSFLVGSDRSVKVKPDVFRIGGDDRGDLLEDLLSACYFFEAIELEIRAEEHVLGDEVELDEGFLDFLDSVSIEDSLLEVCLEE